LVVLTVVVYVAQLFIGNNFTRFFSLNSDWWTHPWEAFRLLTYGFLHSPDSLQHLAFNMFSLWMFGREVEQRYGRKEFLAFYLSAIIVAGFVWSLADGSRGATHYILGASGGAVAVVILFALTFPHRTLLFNFFIPMPAWVVGCIVVAFDLLGAVQGSDPMRGGNVAFTAHLAGAAYAVIYFYTRFNPLEKLLGLTGGFSMPRRAKLRVHAPDSDDDDAEPDIDKEVNRILQKISEQGQESLTWRERRTLEKASREYQNRRK
jgi:membrane associated rhomboid family serine protease